MKEIGDWIATYCPRCSKLNYISWFPTKKSRFCKRCHDENISVALFGLNYPEGYLKKFRRRTFKSFGFMILVIIFTIVPLFMTWLLLGIAPGGDTNTLVENILLAYSMILYMIIVLSVCMLEYHFYCMRPKQRELEKYILDTIHDHIPHDLSELPQVNETIDKSSMLWIKKPQGMRILRLVDRYLGPTMELPCPRCGSLKPTDAIYCDECGIKLRTGAFP